MDEFIERLRAVKWEVIDEGDRMPDDPTHKCVFVDMRPDDFRALLREAAAALEAARAEVERLNRILGRIVACDGGWNLTIRAGTDAFAAAREYLMTAGEVRDYANSRANAALAALAHGGEG